MRRRTLINVYNEKDRGVLEELQTYFSQQGMNTHYNGGPLEIRLYADTPEFELLIAELKRRGLKYKRREVREYTKKEIEQAELFQILLPFPYELDGDIPNYGTTYERSCPNCPESGILYFFYDFEEQPWGYDPQHGKGWKVIYYSGDTAELMCKEPPEDIIVFDACGIDFSSEITIPPWESEYVNKLSLNQAEDLLYYELIEEVETLYKEDDERINRMLGHPDAIQGDMQLECQLVTNGLYCGTTDAYSDPRRFELEKGVQDWVLLFQMDSDEGPGMMWGDDGRIYYWIKKQDLLQCG